MALEESRANGDRLHRESELVVQNVNTWVQEQKSVLQNSVSSFSLLSLGTSFVSAPSFSRVLKLSLIHI